MRAKKGIQSSTLDEQPELFPDIVWIWNCFQLLNETRDYGFGGPLRIRPSDMQALLCMKDVTDRNDRNLFVRVIPLLDAEWLADHYKEQEAKRDKDSKKRR